MLALVYQRLATLFAILAVLGCALLPAEHVHVSIGRDGHPSELVHRHFEPHHRAATYPGVDQSDDDHDIHWLTTSFTRRHTLPHVSADARPVEDVISISRPEPILQTTLRVQFVSVHGPPWATSSDLRAPPASPHLT